jgi:hypothetical protein
LPAIAFEFGGLNIIEQHAFRGLEKSLKGLYFKNNMLTEVILIAFIRELLVSWEVFSTNLFLLSDFKSAQYYQQVTFF